jgi:hypothetical protein
MYKFIKKMFNIIDEILDTHNEFIKVFSPLLQNYSVEWLLWLFL